jgi:hypothetical protein
MQRLPLACLRKLCHWIFLLWIVAGATHISVAYAFESSEHCALSNLAARLAFDFEEAAIRADPSLTSSQDMNAEEFVTYLHIARTEFVSEADENKCLFANWSLHNAAIPFSYGKIVSMVDFTLNPADLFVAMGWEAGSPTNKAQLNDEYFLVDSSLAFRLSLATHNNPDHFQGHALFLFDRWHSNAVNAARNDRRSATPNIVDSARMPNNTWNSGDLLFRALAYNAVADHFLEDSFAPGHIMTPRDGMYDPVALTWHDGFNARGRVLAVRHWATLLGTDHLGIAKFVRDNAAIYTLEFQRIGRAPRNLSRRTAFHDVPKMFAARMGLAQALTDLEYSRERKCHIARYATDVVMEPDKDEFAAILDFNPALLGKLLEKYPDGDASDPESEPSVCVHGDGSLDEHERDKTIKSEVAAQKVLMVLIEAQYIVEVLEAFRSQNDVVVDHKYMWCPMMFRKQALDAPDEKRPPPEACVYVIDEAANICKDTKKPAESCDATFETPTAITPYFAYVSTPNERNHVQFAALDPINFLYAINVGESSTVARALPNIGFEIGTTVICGAEDCLRDRNFKKDDEKGLLLYYGIERQTGNTTQVSKSFTFRATSSLFSALDFQFGPFGKLEDIGNGITRRYRWGYGARSDFGFSMLSFYLTVGEEPRLQIPLRTAREFAVGAGVSGVVNGRRIAQFLGRTWDQVAQGAQ